MNLKLISFVQAKKQEAKITIRNRSAYSFRNAIGNISESHKKVTEICGGFSPLTDTASVFGYTRWTKLSKKANSKPIFGIELAVTKAIHDKKPGYDHWTFIAQDNLRAVHELLLLATQQFRYVPILTLEQANKAQGVFKIAGSKTDYSEVAEEVYVALSPSMNRAQMKKAAELKVDKLVLASDNRYLNEEDKDLYQIQLGRDAAVQTYPQHLMSDEELLNFFQGRIAPFDVGIAMTNRQFVFENSNAHQIQSVLLTPEKPKTLEAMCIEGATILGIDLTDPVYFDRLKRELDLIEKKQFEDYFYIIADLVQWARQRMIVGPARGSSCGSLVCFLLQITTIDPIPYGLIFERFIDINRSDLPDIDIDFAETKRDLVFAYLADKYGPEHVARLGTVALFRPRSALQTTAAALDVPRWRIEKVADNIIEHAGGDARALKATEDTLRETASGRELLNDFPEMIIAAGMEGEPRHSSSHAAGVVITERPVIDYVGLDVRTGATHCDKKDAEELGLLKIDALGLTQLSVFEDCLQMAGLPMDYLDKIRLDDPAAFDVLNRHHYSGIFQFNGAALQGITNQVQIRELNDIIVITALARPGPLDSGGTKQWVRVKTGQEEFRVPHPIFEPYLRETLGVVTYQEQIMAIARGVGQMDWETVTSLRRAISKSQGAEAMAQYAEAFMAGAIAQDVPESVAQRFWADMCAMGAYAFNKAHSVAYGVVSYYCCWLKAHYPVEFAAATLSHTDDVNTQISILREMHFEGIDYIPVDPEISVANWTVGWKGWEDSKKYLIGPLSAVKGIGPKAVANVLSARARGEPLTGKVAKLLANPVTEIDSLWPIEKRFRELMPNPAERNIFTPPKTIKDCQVNGQDQEVLVFCTVASIKPKDENEEVNVQKRGYRFKGATQALNLRLSDDTDSVFAKVDRFDYPVIGVPIVERGRAGKALYAIKGIIPSDFRMIRVKHVRYIGDLELDKGEKNAN